MLGGTNAALRNHRGRGYTEINFEEPPIAMELKIEKAIIQLGGVIQSAGEIQPVRIAIALEYSKPPADNSAR